MRTKELKAHCALDEPTLELLKMAMTELKLSARAYDRILKVARTIADLAGSERLTSDPYLRSHSISFARSAVVGVKGNRAARSESYVRSRLRLCAHGRHSIQRLIGRTSVETED